MKKKQNNKDVVTRQSDIHGKLTEWICPHGVGHHRGIHGCDGCCANESKMEQTTYEETTAHNDHVGKADDMVPPQSHIEEILKEFDDEFASIFDDMGAYGVQKGIKDFIKEKLFLEQSHAYRRAVGEVEKYCAEMQGVMNLPDPLEMQEELRKRIISFSPEQGETQK
jgi:hypothetical protein